jgi:membrane protein YdbS with pleckstrin-like domain
MLCPSCKSDLPAGSAFCPQCGTRINGSATPPGAADKLKAAQAASAANNDPEQPLWNGGFSAKAMYGSWLLAGLVTIASAIASVLLPMPITWLVAAVVVAALWLVLFAYYLYERLAVNYSLTTQRLMCRRGILKQVTDRTEVIDIDDVQYTQGIVERMFGVGTIKLLSSDTSDPTLVLRGIDDVQRVANLIDNARREERRKRGLYMETV